MVQADESLLRHFHIIDTCYLSSGMCDSLGQHLWIGNREGEMLIGDALTEGSTRKIGVVCKKVLIVVLASSEWGHRREDFFLAQVKDLGTGTAKHRCASMLGTYIAKKAFDTCCLTSQPIGTLGMYAEKIAHRTHVVGHAYGGTSITEEVCGLAGHQGEEVIIEIYKFLSESLYLVHEHLNSSTIESRQISLGDKVAMQHHSHPITVDPCWHLTFTGYYKKDIFYEWHTFVNATEKVGQCTPIPIALGQSLLPDTTGKICLPFRIASINVCYDYVHSLSSMPETKEHLI